MTSMKEIRELAAEMDTETKESIARIRSLDDALLSEALDARLKAREAAEPLVIVFMQTLDPIRSVALASLLHRVTDTETNIALLFAEQLHRGQTNATQS